MCFAILFLVCDSGSISTGSSVSEITDTLGTFSSAGRELSVVFNNVLLGYPAPGPLPLTLLISTPYSLAIALATGVASSFALFPAVKDATAETPSLLAERTMLLPATSRVPTTPAPLPQQPLSFLCMEFRFLRNRLQSLFRQEHFQHELPHLVYRI